MAISIALDRLLNGLGPRNSNDHSHNNSHGNSHKDAINNNDTTNNTTTNDNNNTTNNDNNNNNTPTNTTTKVDGSEDDADFIAYMPLLACPTVREAVLLLSPNVKGPSHR